MTTAPIAFVDANVLYAAAPRDLIMQLNAETEVTAVHPDPFPVAICHAAPDVFHRCVAAIRDRLNGPPATVAGYLDSLRRNQLPLLAAELAKRLEPK